MYELNDHQGRLLKEYKAVHKGHQQNQYLEPTHKILFFFF